MQAVAPVALENLPAKQPMHSALPDTSEYAPAPQSEHQEDEVAPTVAEALPAAHAVHSVAAVALENLPAKQPMHSALPDTSEYVPAPHEIHSVLADTLEACIVTVADRYDPSSQGKKLTSLEVSIRTVRAPSTDTTPAGSTWASRILLILGQLLSSPPVVR